MAVIASLAGVVPISAIAQQAPTATPDTEDPPPPRPFTPKPAPEPEWYGGKVLLVDGASALLLVIPPVGLAGLGLGAPAVHVMNGRPGVAVGSLALRVGAVLWGIALAMPSDECEHIGKGCTSHLAPLPLLGAMAFDAAFLSWKMPDGERAAAPAVLPAIAITPGGGAVGLSGRF